METRILITGAGKNSFLGFHLKKYYKNHNNINFVGSEFDLTNKNEAFALFEKYKPEIVVMGAAKCGGILANKNNPALFLRDNLLININTYDAAKSFNIKKVIGLGSVCMYPHSCPVPFKEDNIFDGKPEITNFPYGESKRVLYLLGKTYQEQYGLKSVFLVPVNMFGENDHFDMTNSHVIPAMIAKFSYAKLHNINEVKLFGTGKASREFLHASDLVRAINLVIQKNIDYSEPINIGTGKEIYIKDLAYMIARMIKYDGKIIFADFLDGQPRRQLDVSRAKEILGFEANINLKEGLQKTIDWYIENYEK